MNKLTNLAVAGLLVAGISTGFASTSERLKATGENIQGNTQEAIGNMTNDPQLKAKGQLNQAKSKLRNTKEDLKDQVNGDES